MKTKVLHDCGDGWTVVKDGTDFVLMNGGDPWVWINDHGDFCTRPTGRLSGLDFPFMYLQLLAKHRQLNK